LTPAVAAHRGEHVGLDIMRERAELLAGVLTIESESGEGTRVSLSFSANPVVKRAQAG